MNKLLLSLLLTAGIFSTQSVALDLGKVLKDAAKQEVEKVKKSGEPAPTETPATVPVESSATTSPAAPSVGNLRSQSSRWETTRCLRLRFPLLQSDWSE